MNDNIKLLVVDDHEMIRTGLKALFKDDSELNIVAEASNGSMALELAQKHAPDILITDIMLPDISGIELIKQFVNLKIRSKIVVLTSYNTESDINSAISLGVYAYILKDIDPELLMFVLKSVYDGAMWIDPKVAPMVRGFNTKYSSDNLLSRSEFKQFHFNLTKREYEVLKLIVDGKSNSDIADILSISEHTAKAHVCNIMQKLVVDDRTQAAVKALKNGLV